MIIMLVYVFLYINSIHKIKERKKKKGIKTVSKVMVNILVGND